MRFIHKMAFLVFLLLFSLLATAQTRQLDEIMTEEARGKLHYVLISPVIHSHEFEESERGVSDTLEYRQRLRPLSQMIAIQVEREQPSVEVLIKTTKDFVVDELLIRDAGIISGEEYDYVMGTVSISDLVALAEIREVVMIEPAFITHSELNESAHDINANAVWVGGDENNPLPDCITGKGVYVGIIDSKPNRNHITFEDSEGSSRFEHYDNSDPRAHGTHVAGIAGGRGDADGNKRGIAYEADLLWSQYGYTNAALAAVQGMIEQANGSPLVINYSVGHFFGPRDGSTVFEQALTNLITGNTVFVKSAGNNSTDNYYNHYEGVVPQQQGEFLEFSFSLSTDTLNATSLEIWHESQFDVQVSSLDPADESAWNDIVAFGDSETFTF